MKKEEKLSLTVTKRTVFGKKLKALRRNEILPGNIFGESMKSEAVQLPFKSFITTFKKAGETQIVYITVEGSEKELPVLIQNAQRHPVTDHLLHVDFRKVNLKKKIETHVPLQFINESDAVAQNKGILLTLAETLLIEALPEEIPAHIEVDISVLHELNDEIKVKDLKVSGNYTVKDDPEKIVIRISEHKEEEITPQIVAPETVEITTEKKEGEETASDESAPEGKDETKE
jgi:large subunit ribosomal protein L25